MRTEKQKTIDNTLLLMVIQRCQPVSMDRLQDMVFLMQKLGLSFSYDDWVWVDEKKEVKKE